MIERIYNFLLLFLCYIRCLFKFKPNGKIPIAISGYKVEFCDYFKGNKLSNHIWQKGQVWGEFHPEHLHQYYGTTDDFIFVKDGYLNLTTQYKPQKFYDFKNEINAIIPYGIGLVVSKRTFTYGYFEIKAVLPQGKWLFPAIWLSNTDTWPPEIDIIEGYSKAKGKYKNSLGLSNFKFQPNIHYGFKEANTKSSFGGSDFPLPNNPTEREVTYAVLWTPNSIVFYYDGYKIFQTKQKNILEYFNTGKIQMHIILNNGMDPKSNSMKLEPSVFKIKSVKYLKKV